MAVAGKVAITLSTENGGAWSAGVTYDRLVAVKHNNSLYISRKVVTNVEPPNDEFWFLALEGYSGEDVQALIDQMNAVISGTTQVGNAKTLDGHGASYFAKDSDLKNGILTNTYHNNPRNIPKDITTYYQDGTLWSRLNGTDGFTLFEDIFAGDYFQMSRPISAYNQNQEYQLTGSDWVTIAGIDSKMNDGYPSYVNYHHLVMVPGKGFSGSFHFGRSRMNPTDTTEGGYVGSEMYTTTIGEVTTTGSTEATATINQQLYAEFGNHLKTTRELLSNSLNPTGYNRFGTNSGCSNSWDWYDCQAVLMSEVQVYGSIVWSSSGYDTGTTKNQLPIFRDIRFLNNRSSWYWLKDVATSAHFCYVNGDGSADYYSASVANGCVRPCFVIGA